MFPVLHLSVPALSARVSPATVASVLARLIADGTAASKADLVRETRLSRSTVDAGLQLLQDLQAVRSVGLREAAGRGRRAEVLELNPDLGLVTVLDFGVRGVRIGIADLGQHVLDSCELSVPVSVGPAAALDAAMDAAERMIDEADLRERHRVTVVGVPGPVDARAGTVVRPPIMPGWDGYDIGGHARRRLGGDAIVANDVNLRALGEARASGSTGPVLYLKVSSGIGAGFTSGRGELLSGADGAAGAIAHLRVFGSEAPCHCGRTGCVEASASVSALARARYGDEAASIDAFLRDLRAGDPECRALVASASQTLGEVITEMVLFSNPSRVLLGGEIAQASDDLLVGVRGVVYRQAPALATRNLVIETAPLGREAGIAGGVVLGIEASLAPTRISALVAQRDARERFAEVTRRATLDRRMPVPAA